MNDWVNIVKANLTRLLTPMDIPAMRRDLDNLENIYWLIRNLGINNSSHEDYKNTMTKLLSLNGILTTSSAEVLFTLGRNKS